MSHINTRMYAYEIDNALSAFNNIANADNNNLVVYIKDGMLACDSFSNLFSVNEFTEEEYLPNSIFENILSESYFGNFPNDISVTKWDSINIKNRSGDKIYTDIDSIITDECVSFNQEYLLYGIPSVNAPITIYGVSKGNAGNGSRIFGVVNTQNTTIGWLSSNKFRYSNGSSTINTTINSSDYAVLVLRINEEATTADYFINGIKQNTLNIQGSSQTLKFGCSDNYTQYHGTTYHKFFGVVNNAESDAIIVANSSHLMTKFNIG